MEHRIGIRRPIGAGLLLRISANRCFPGIAREASISGMFVETAAEVFPINGVIEVELSTREDGVDQTFRWRAMVIRKTGNGLGLMFDRLRPAGIGWLLDRFGADATDPTPPAHESNVVRLSRREGSVQP